MEWKRLGGLSDAKRQISLVPSHTSTKHGHVKQKLPTQCLRLAQNVSPEIEMIVSRNFEAIGGCTARHCEEVGLSICRYWVEPVKVL